MHHTSNMSSNDKEEELTNFEIVKSIDQSLEASSNSNSHYSQNKKEEINIDKHKKETEETSKTLSSSSSASSLEDKLKEKDEEEEEEDGFRTPTTLDHKISVLTCPPAPKKIKQSLKRRAASYNDQYCNCRELPLDVAKEVELLFQIKQIPFSDSHGAKKIRRDNQELK